jgi:hypothetical protein
MEHNLRSGNMNDRRSIEELFCDLDGSLNAIAMGVRQALWRHKQLGQSVAIWRDGKVVILKPEEIQVDSPE